MAYIDKERGVIILFPHKTGSTTLRTILKEHGRIGVIRYRDVINHPNLNRLKSDNPDIPDLFDYQVYGFYREPVSKFISFVKYNYQQFPLMEPYTNIHNYVEKYGFFAPQTRWLKHDKVNVRLLDFANFEENVRFLLGKVGLPTNIPIPRENTSAGTLDHLTIESLTPAEIQEIKNLSKEDYEFFASKGITFPI